MPSLGPHSDTVPQSQRPRSRRGCVAHYREDLLPSSAAPLLWHWILLTPSLTKSMPHFSSLTETTPGRQIAWNLTYKLLVLNLHLFPSKQKKKPRKGNQKPLCIPPSHLPTATKLNDFLPKASSLHCPAPCRQLAATAPLWQISLLYWHPWKSSEGPGTSPNWVKKKSSFHQKERN